jgi:hypothetical protein
MGKKLNLEWAHRNEPLKESDIQQYCLEHQQQDKLLTFAKMKMISLRMESLRIVKLRRILFKVLPPNW